MNGGNEFKLLVCLSDRRLKSATSTHIMLPRTLLLSSIALWAKAANAAFGIVNNGDSYTIDAGSANPLKFTVSQSSCDITSISYYGAELQYQSTGSHIGSGLGSATVSATQDGRKTGLDSSRACADTLKAIISR